MDREVRGGLTLSEDVHTPHFSGLTSVFVSTHAGGPVLDLPLHSATTGAGGTVTA